MACTDRVCSTLWVALASGYNDRRTHDEACRSLSDLRYPKQEVAVADSDTIPLPPVVKPVFVDTCRTGMTCIEDYGDSTRRGMASFMKRSTVLLLHIQIMTGWYVSPFSVIHL